MPKTLVRNLKTCAMLTLDPGAGGSLAAQQLKLNSAFDPTGTVGASQPLGFDQYAALYKKYCVIRWSVKAEAVNNDNTNALVFGFTPMLEATALTNYNHYKEMPNTRSDFLTIDHDKSVVTNRGGVKAFFPPGGRMLADDTLCALTTADPSRILYGHIWC